MTETPPRLCGHGGVCRAEMEAMGPLVPTDPAHLADAIWDDIRRDDADESPSIWDRLVAQEGHWRAEAIWPAATVYLAGKRATSDEEHADLMARAAALEARIPSVTP